MDASFSFVLVSAPAGWIYSFARMALSEYDNHLRGVTTTGETWHETSETHVRDLRESDGELKASKVGGLSYVVDERSLEQAIQRRKDNPDGRVAKPPE